MHFNFGQGTLQVHIIVIVIIPVHIDTHLIAGQKRGGVHPDQGRFKHMDRAVVILIAAKDFVAVIPVYIDTVIGSGLDDLCHDVIAPFQQELLLLFLSSCTDKAAAPCNKEADTHHTEGKEKHRFHSNANDNAQYGKNRADDGKDQTANGGGRAFPAA